MAEHEYRVTRVYDEYFKDRVGKNLKKLEYHSKSLLGLCALLKSVE